MNFIALIRTETIASAKILGWVLGWISVVGVGTLLAETPASTPTAKMKHSADRGWSRFHGPQGRGAVDTGSLPATWTPDDYAWTVQLSGINVGSPVANDSTVFLLDSKIAEQPSGDAAPPASTIDLIALDLVSGQERWRHSHRIVATKRHNRNTPASTTPVIDADRVFFAYGDAEGAYLYAYSVDGEPLWQRQLGPWLGVHGFGTSPTVIDGQLILFNSQQADELEPGQHAGESRIMSLDPVTGEDLWSTPLNATSNCYGVPALYVPAAGDPPSHTQKPSQIIAANKGNGLFGLDLATGEMLWSLDVFNKRCCSSPLVIGDLAIGTCGSGGGGNTLSAVRIPNQPGQVPEEVFRITSGAPYVPTAAVKDGLLFVISDAGIASCFDTQDGGRKLWSRRIGGNFGASPIIVGNQLLLIGLDGSAHITTASPKPSTISEFDLGGKVGATPAYASHRLILRVGSKLHCLLTDLTE